MNVRLKLSGNLKLIFTEWPNEKSIEINEPITISNLLMKMGINPLLVMIALVNSKAESKDFLITEDCEVQIIGPISGG